MNLPSYEAMMPAVLASLADGKTRPLREVFELVSQHYAFSAEQLAETLPSGRQTTIRSRVGWAKTYLVKAGLITQPKRGLCVITQRGLEALTSGQTIDNRYLAQFGEFVAFTLTSRESIAYQYHTLLGCHQNLPIGKVSIAFGNVMKVLIFQYHQKAIRE